jgi:hypothetical protein
MDVFAVIGPADLVSAGSYCSLIPMLISCQLPNKTKLANTDIDTETGTTFLRIF